MTIYRQNPQAQPQNRLGSEVYDVVVIGAGVVGCAVARRFVLEGARVAVVEGARDILDGASKANSAILHTGFDAPPGSLELQCIREGYQEYVGIHGEMGLPLARTGAHVVAWNADQAARLEALRDQAWANGIADVSLISAGELLAREPNLADHARSAVSIPGEAIIDPWSAPYAYLSQALANGAAIFLGCEVTRGEFSAGTWRLETPRGFLECRTVINCAGLHGDRVDRALLGEAGFRITPRKGQFVVFDKAAFPLVTSIILPVPTDKTKGVVVCRTIFGNLLVGPTAEDQDSRSDSSTDGPALAALIASGIEKLPALAHMPVTAVYAGLRPATEHKDYQISAKPGRNWITVGGIRSTGLSGALGIAGHVFRLYSARGAAHAPIANPQIPKARRLAEDGTRDWQGADHGAIICHCERVTAREIKDALTGPLAARSLSGLKRQTRVTMGRCQGFYCTARLAELTAGKFDVPLALPAPHD